MPTIPGFSTKRKESLNSSLSYQEDAKILTSIAAIITQLRERWQVYLFAQEIFTTQHDKVTPLGESSVFDNHSTKCWRFMIIS